MKNRRIEQEKTRKVVRRRWVNIIRFCRILWIGGSRMSIVCIVFVSEVGGRSVVVVVGW